MDSNGSEHGVRSSAAPKITAKRSMIAKLSSFENNRLSLLPFNGAVTSFSITYLYVAGA